MLGFSLYLLTHSAYTTSSLSRVSLDYRRADFDGISCFLLDHDFSSYYKSYDIEFLWRYLIDTILSSISLFTPAVKKRFHYYPQWFTSSIKHQLHKVHSQWKEWRNHDITPIPKSKEKSIVSNYRSISLLSCISKILERLVFDKINDFVFQNCISHCQFGFVRNRSTLQQLLQYLDFVHTSIDNSHQVDSIYLDI